MLVSWDVAHFRLAVLSDGVGDDLDDEREPAVRHRLGEELVHDRQAAAAGRRGSLVTGFMGAPGFIVDPKNLLLAASAGSALAVIGPSTTEAAVALIVFVVIGSLTIAGPVVFYLTGGDRAKIQLDSAKDWLAIHNDAVMTVLFLVLGVNLIAKGIPPLTW